MKNMSFISLTIWGCHRAEPPRGRTQGPITWLLGIEALQKSKSRRSYGNSGLKITYSIITAPTSRSSERRTSLFYFVPSATKWVQNMYSHNGQLEKLSKDCYFLEHTKLRPLESVNKQMEPLDDPMVPCVYFHWDWGSKMRIKGVLVFSKWS